MIFALLINGCAHKICDAHAGDLDRILETEEESFGSADIDREIEEARKRGYSWTQIGRAARAAWSESGEWDEGKCFDLGTYYNKFKTEAV